MDWAVTRPEFVLTFMIVLMIYSFFAAEQYLRTRRIRVWAIAVLVLLVFYLCMLVVASQPNFPWVLVFMWVVPVFAGILGAHRLTAMVNFFLMMETFQVTITVGGLIRGGTFDPMFLIPGAGILPGIGRYSGISIGGFIFPLFFALFAIIGSAARRTMHR